MTIFIQKLWKTKISLINEDPNYAVSEITSLLRIKLIADLCSVTVPKLTTLMFAITVTVIVIIQKITINPQSSQHTLQMYWYL